MKLSKTKDPVKSISNKDKIIHKRTPQHLPIKKNDIYVSRKSSYIALIKRAKKLLLEKETSFIVLHGLGAAIKITVNLALELKKQFSDKIDWEITTSTVKLYDDVEPENKEEDLITETRNNSAITIKIFKKNK
ncbi:hypothetical protein H8356DRAFT_1292545 [Neocallimastix lanati (nom. inval.)]|uniref:Ribonuclease P protein subunit p20 n=1 Tax=Neocallimastix californiae TaxID=1754190 RepID=A0A1Y2E8G1_9FUNG|nr:hypothetical protein H8356DRAFT_1292545 [Neocallimastix sp. JGI-2020a]ORY67848.1 hypothetical protein LY90DRAFT_700470 [Neocallimastix californiae]|eukprot:ORY67848.1 hypothetical protein LY90DRAFT_700470 [Neocallimastix californiae]